MKIFAGIFFALILIGTIIFADFWIEKEPSPQFSLTDISYKTIEVVNGGWPPHSITYFYFVTSDGRKIEVTRNFYSSVNLTEIK